MYDASSEQRKAISAATSDGIPGRPIGVLRPASISRSLDEAVLIHPGATALTVIPDPPVSNASARVSPAIPALAALYADIPGLLATGPVTELTFTTRPYSFLIICGNADRVMLKQVFRFNSISLSHCDSVSDLKRASNSF